MENEHGRRDINIKSCKLSTEAQAFNEIQEDMSTGGYTFKGNHWKWARVLRHFQESHEK